MYIYIYIYIFPLSRRILANYYQQVPWQEGYGEWKELRKLTSSPKALIYFQLLTCSFPARAGRREGGQGCPDHSRLRQEPSGFTRMLMLVRNVRRKEGRKEGRQCLSSLPQAAPPGRSRSLRGWALVWEQQDWAQEAALPSWHLGGERGYGPTTVVLFISYIPDKQEEEPHNSRCSYMTGYPLFPSVSTG